MRLEERQMGAEKEMNERSERRLDASAELKRVAPALPAAPHRSGPPPPPHPAMGAGGPALFKSADPSGLRLDPVFLSSFPPFFRSCVLTFFWSSDLPNFSEPPNPQGEVYLPLYPSLALARQVPFQVTPPRSRLFSMQFSTLIFDSILVTFWLEYAPKWTPNDIKILQKSMKIIP